jgi:glycosyltransferase involved in cell wall biosynthesis
VRVVGISLVRNEDRFIRQALLNVAGFCDRVVVADHMSTDRTPSILAELSRAHDRVDVHRIKHSAESHALVAGYAGTDTWVLSVDGDELYDPDGLVRLRRELEQGAYDDVFRVRPAGLHCEELDESQGLATGYLSPPSRPLVGLLNFAAIDSWTDVRSERLHGGEIVFRSGFDLDRWRHLGSELGWDDSPFRCLHVCFLRRSSGEPRIAPGTGRPNLAETRSFRLGLLGRLERLARVALVRRQGPDGDAAAWKAEKYRRGERVTVDVSPILGRR